MAKGEAVMLAHSYKDEKYQISNWYMSQKMDGMRALWDGGVTRGMFCDQVPFANTEKDARYLVRPKATGLWSRAFKPIMAPEFFLNSLPPYPLDGELYLGNGRFQELMSIVKDLNPGAGWKDVMYQVFDSPSLRMVFGDREIKTPNFKKTLNLKQIRDNLRFELTAPTSFDTTYKLLQKNLNQNSHLKLLDQWQLPNSQEKAEEVLRNKVDEIVSYGGEGLIIRHPHSIWIPQRSHNLLKVKKPFDSEGTVTGYISGRKTDLGSKLLGLMGALVLDYKGHRLELSGFTDEERSLTSLSAVDAFSYASEFPETEMPDWITNEHFPRGSIVTFKYSELSDTGIPLKARYWRK